MTGEDRGGSGGRRAFERALLRALRDLLPREFREEYGEELEEVASRRLQGLSGWRRARGVARETLDLSVTAVREHWAGSGADGRGDDGRPNTGGAGTMETLLQDVRYGARGLFRRPGFALVALVTVALGVGATTALFSVLNAVLLRPLPYEDPEGVVRLYASWRGWEQTWLSEPEIVDLQRSVDGLTEVAAWSGGTGNITGDGEPERVSVASTMPRAFDVLGVAAAVGRTFTPEEGRPGGGDGVALLGHGIFERRFGGDPDIVGRTIQLDGSARTVVGVLPADFRLPSEFQELPSEIYVPLVIDPDSLGGRGSHYLHAVGRVAPGSALPALRAELGALGVRLTEEGGYAPQAGFTFRAFPIRDDVFGAVRPALLVLAGAVGFVLLIACANVANLLLVRGEGRLRELALRTALGARRWRVVRQLLTESVLLSFLGGVVGVGLAWAGTRALVALDPARVPRLSAAAVDLRVLGFGLLVALLTGAVFGVAPALQALRVDPHDHLREGARGGAGGRRRARFRSGLVVAEVALAVVLVIGAGLMIRTFAALRAIDPGFEPEGVLTLRLSLPSSSYPEDADVIAFFDRLVERTEGLPGVEAVGAVRQLPLQGTIGDWSIDIEDVEEAPGENPHGDWQTVTPGYFEAMGLRLVEGRLIEETDDGSNPPVAVVNRTMADTYWPDGALGRRFRAAGEWTTIVGVVEDVRHNALVEEPREEMYHAHAQYPAGFGFAPRSMSLVVETSGDPLALAGPVRNVVREMDPDLPLSQVASMESVVGDALSEQRFTMTLLGVFGAVALLLAAVGIYGVLAYAVSRRTREIGIRMALGAGRKKVLRLVVGEGMALAALGIGGGVLLALAVTRLMASILYGVGTVDVWTFAGVAALMVGVALAATGIPAMRASGVQPVTALREE